ncbi:MAG: hypothetical protein WCS43_16110 [Verrucomicrobiota bacterium]
MFVEGVQSIAAGGIANTNFFGKGGNCRIRAAIIMQDGVENIEGVLGLLAITKGAELEREKRTDFAYTGSKFLLSTVQIETFDSDTSCCGQGAFHTGHYCSGDILNLGASTGERRFFD